MRTRIGAGALAGLIAAAVVDVVMLGRTLPATDAHHEPVLAFVAEAAHAHGPLAGGLIVLVYGGIVGALFGWLASRHRITELSGLYWGVLYGLSWAIVSGLIVVPLLHRDIPFGTEARLLVGPALFASSAGHVLYGAMLGVAFAAIVRRIVRPRAQERQQAIERRAA